jgi:hydroxymethylbilane synthase
MTVSADTLRVGTRRSALARAQSGAVAAALGHVSGQPVEVVGISTYGDVAPGAIASLGGTGVFVSALRERLLAGEIDLAVHSYKDLPTAPQPGLTIAAVPPREDPRDVLVSGVGPSLARLPHGARIGTGAPRRAAQIRAFRPDLQVAPLRGNVGTRIGAVASGRLDGIVLARAGLARLGRLSEVTEVLDPSVMLPAPAQGALAVECRADDTGLRELLAHLDCSSSRAAVTAERTLLAAVAAGCSAPLGALAELSDDSLTLRAVIAAHDGARVLRMSLTGAVTAAAELGHRLATSLLAAGAAKLLEER